MDYSSPFLRPPPLFKPLELELPTSTCLWIFLIFLTGHTEGQSSPHSTGSNHSITPLHSSNTFVKFLRQDADDTTVVELISGGEESACRGEEERLWCRDHNLLLNTSKEQVVDFIGSQTSVSWEIILKHLTWGVSTTELVKTHSRDSLVLRKDSIAQIGWCSSATPPQRACACASPAALKTASEARQRKCSGPAQFLTAS